MSSRSCFLNLSPNFCYQFTRKGAAVKGGELTIRSKEAKALKSNEWFPVSLNDLASQLNHNVCKDTVNKMENRWHCTCLCFVRNTFGSTLHCM